MGDLIAAAARALCLMGIAFIAATRVLCLIGNPVPTACCGFSGGCGERAGVSGRDYGPIGTIPEIPGLAVWMNGHIGVYVGNGYVVEAANTSAGVIRTRLSGGRWTNWCKIPYIDYLE